MFGGQGLTFEPVGTTGTATEASAFGPSTYLTAAPPQQPPPLPAVVNDVTGVSMHYATDEQVLASSVVEIDSDKLESGGRPHPGGVCDERLGVTSGSRLCGTCFNTSGVCLGHSGHVRLHSSIIQPMLTDSRDGSRLCCLYCGVCGAWRLRKSEEEGGGRGCQMRGWTTKVGTSGRANAPPRPALRARSVPRSNLRTAS